MQLMPLLARHGYLLVFLVLFVEGMGVPGVPFEALFVATGWLAAAGHLRLPWCVAAGTAGTTLGNLAGYGLGWLGRSYLTSPRSPRFCRLTPERQAAVDRWFRQYGPAIIFVARWFGPIRTPAILGAGIARLPVIPYGLYALAAALLWNLAWQVGTYHFGTLVLRIWDLCRWWAALLVPVLAGTAWLLSRRGQTAATDRN